MSLFSCKSDDDDPTVTPQKTGGSISYATTTVSKTTADEAFTNTLTNTGDGTVSYASSKTDVAEVNTQTGLVTIKGAGETTITATVADSDTYTYATKTASYTLTVTQTYTVTIASDIEHGTVTADKTSAEKGATVTLTLSASDGYEFGTLSVTDASNAEITTTAVTEGSKYTFTMPESNVTVSATFKATAVTAITLSLTSPAVGQVIGSDGKNYAAASVPSGVTKVAMIAYVSGSNGLAIALADEGSLNWETAKSTCEAKTPAFTNGTWKLPTKDEWNQMLSANGGSEDSYTGLNTAITTAGGTTLQGGKGYWSSTPDGSKAYYLWLQDGDTDWRSLIVAIGRQVRACLAF